MNIYVYVHWRWGQWLSSKASEHYFLYHCYGSFFLWFSICLQQKVTARFMKDNHTTNTFFNHVIQYGANNGGWDKQIAAWNMEELTPENLNNLECIHTHIYIYTYTTHSICRIAYIYIYIYNQQYHTHTMPGIKHHVAHRIELCWTQSLRWQIQSGQAQGFLKNKRTSPLTYWYLLGIWQHMATYLVHQADVAMSAQNPRRDKWSCLIC